MKINPKDSRVPLCEKMNDRGAEIRGIEVFARNGLYAGTYPAISRRRTERSSKAQIEGSSSSRCLHRASKRCALSLIFQGMEAAGEDRAIRHAMSVVNPRDCQAFSF